MDGFDYSVYWLVLGAYVALSLLLFALYGIDKAAARHRRRRISERSLHVLALLGGWPGGLAGQAAFHHKTRKASFRRVFWCTVLLNCGALALLIGVVGSRW